MWLVADDAKIAMKKKGLKTEGFEIKHAGYSSGEIGLLFRDDEWFTKYMPAVEERLDTLTKSHIEQVTEIARHMVFGSGKRLRPAFSLAGYLLTAQGLSPQAVDLAACSEIVHCAALFHDDVIDSAGTRKGRPSANALWGNHIAVVIGDYLFGVAFDVIGWLKRQDILDEYIQVALRLAEGVILELSKKTDSDIQESEYLDIISRKTASFFRAVTRAGAMLAGAPKETVDASGKFAYNFGMAFQITDDVLDLFSEEYRTGKPRGTDVREGIYTLPLIYAMRNGNGELLERLNGDEDIDDSDIDFIAEQVETSGGLAYAVERARDYHRRSLESLNELPHSESRDFLRRTTSCIVTRQF
jgi:geranylgeranyl pyrophosphate synthase